MIPGHSSLPLINFYFLRSSFFFLCAEPFALAVMDKNTGDEMLNMLASEMMFVARVGWEVWLGHLLVAVCVASLPLMYVAIWRLYLLSR